MSSAIRAIFFLAATLPLFASGQFLEANRGQFSSDVRFLARNSAVSTAITGSGIEFRGYHEHISLKLDGAQLRCSPASPIMSEAHYLALSVPISHVPQYSSVVCRDAYPGIDWVVRGAGSSLEHDWNVAAGADAQAIRLSLDGTASAHLTPGGDLQLQSGELFVTWKPPKSYQILEGTRTQVESSYVIQGRRISVKLGAYRRDLALIIDPVIDFSYIVSGGGDYRGLQVALDAAGNIYFAGLTMSPDFQTTSGAAFGSPVPMTGGSYQVFVQKLSPDGSKVIYSTYLGLSNFYSPHPLGMRTDAAGNVYLATDFFEMPTGITSTIDPDGVIGVYKLAPAGDSLIYGARVLSNVGYDANVGLAVDSTGNAFVGAGDGMVVISKIDPTGTKQLYLYSTTVSNYSGGLADLAVGSDGTLYMAGTTAMGGLVTTPGALKTTVANSQNYHGYLIRLKADGSGPIFSTYIASDDVDSISALAIDSSGAAYMGGQTNSEANFSGLQGVSLGGLQAASTSGFIMKVDAQGDAALFTSLLPRSTVNALALDSTGNIYSAGLISGFAIPEAPPAGIVVSKVNAEGTQLIYNSSIPASIPASQSGDFAFGMAVDSAGAAYLAGSLTNAQIPASFGASSLPPNAFLLKVDPNPSQCDLWIEQPPSQSYTPGQSVSLRFKIYNAGPATATDVVVSAAIQGPSLSQCRATGSAVCTATTTQNPRVSFPSIPPDGSETVELDFDGYVIPPGNVNATATVSALTSDVNLGNNTVTATNVAQYVTVYVSSNFLGTFNAGLTYTITGATQPFTGFAGLPSIPSYAPPNGQVQIFWPSPQASGFGPAAVFQKWQDGSTDNPRTFTATPPALSVYAIFGLLQTPYFTSSGVVNAGSYAANGVSPGEYVALGGVDLGLLGSATVQDGRLTTTLGMTTVTFDGTPAPLVYSSSSQINAIVPYEVAGKSSTIVQVQFANAKYSAAVPVVQAVPALFTANSSGTGQAAALNQDGSINSPSNPANPGDVIVLYGTGEGLVTPIPADGAIVSTPEPAPQLPITVSIGGMPAHVQYAAAAPGLAAGLIQINAVIPSGVTASHHVPVTWSAGNYTSQPGVTIAVNDSGSSAFVFQPGSDNLALSRITLSPSRIPADSNSTAVTVYGTGFSQGMIVMWNNQTRPTQFLDSTRLQVTLSGVDLESPELGSVAVWDAAATTQISQATALLVYLPLFNRDLLYDSMRDKIYVAVAAAQVPQGSSIASIDPETGRIERWYPLDVEPTKLTISGDYHYLYVALGNLVRRINLDSWTADLDISLGDNGEFGPREVFSMVTLPGTNNSLAVAFTQTGLSPPYLGTGVFDDAVLRGTVDRDSVSYLFGGPDASTLYGGDETGDLYTLKVDSSGIRVLSTSSGLLGNVGGSVYSGGLIYDGFTGIVDPAIPKIVTMFDNQGSIAPLPAGSQVLILGGVPPPEYPPQFVNPVLTLNDVITGISMWSLPLPLQIVDYHGPMLFWGTNGVALREGQYGDTPAPGVDLFRLSLGQ